MSITGDGLRGATSRPPPNPPLAGLTRTSAAH
ncbi:hypothetical protein KY49_1636 [Burkholderia sp. MSHR3999]|nr:hypothetical protein KY49_1636 [Burkholderia sp. MSHR3999]